MVVNQSYDSMAERWNRAVYQPKKGWAVPVQREDGANQTFQLRQSNDVRISRMFDALTPEITIRGGYFPGAGRFRGTEDRRDNAGL